MLRDADFGLCINDAVIFKVDITVHGELQVVSEGNSTLSSSSLTHPYSLETSLKTLFNDVVTSDTRIMIVNESEVKAIHAHRCILMARSEIFRIMFTSQMSEQATGEVIITDIEYDVMFELLHYMYTDNLPDRKFLAQHAVSLLRACQKYQFHALAQVCQCYLCEYLQVSSVLGMLRFADELSCFFLKQKCLIYIAENAPKITNRSEINDLSAELKQEMMHAIEMVNRRKGCRRIYDRKSRYNVTCSLM